MEIYLGLITEKLPACRLSGSTRSTRTVVALVLKAKAQPKQRPKQSSHNKTIKTEQTLKKGGDKSPSSFQKDFIEQKSDTLILLGAFVVHTLAILRHREHF